MKTKIIRVAQGKNSTLSHLYIDGIFQCFLLEDKIRAVKIMKQTAIPEGIFKLRLTQITQLKFFEISLWGNPKFRRTIFCVFW